MKTIEKIKLGYRWNWRVQFVKSVCGKEVAAGLEEFFGIFKNLLAVVQGILWCLLYVIVGPVSFVYLLTVSPIVAGFKMQDSVAPKVKKMLDDSDCTVQ
jgi:hypothetical protein